MRLSMLAALTCLLPLPARSQGAVLSVAFGSGQVDIGLPAIPTLVQNPGSRVARRIAWHSVQPGLDMALLDLRAGELAMRVEAVVVRMQPDQFRFSLQHAVQQNGMSGTWTIDSAGSDAALAMNAGQFKETGPWGWLVMEGDERRNPGRAPLAAGVRIDTAGRMQLLPAGRERSYRADVGTAYAFQSFPLLFRDRRVPSALRDTALVDLGHRDARLMLAECDDGTLLFVLTRFAGLGAVAERVPIGLTTPESVALAAALGARHALMLDGGTSAQLEVRGVGTDLRWPGLRKVPLGLVARPRQH